MDELACALLDAHLEGAMRRLQLALGAPPLAHAGRHGERRWRDEPDEELDQCHVVGACSGREGTLATHGARERFDGDDEHRERGLARAEAQGSPDDERHDDALRLVPHRVGNGRVREDGVADEHDRHEQDDDLDAARAAPWQLGGGGPAQRDGRDDEDPHGIAGPPNRPGVGKLAPRDEPARGQGKDADRGRDAAGEGGDDEQRDDVLDALERGFEAGAAPEEPAGDGGLERIAEADGERHAERFAGQRVCHGRADEDARCRAKPEEHQRRKRNPGGRPEGADLRHAHAERQAELRGADIERSHDADEHQRGEVESRLANTESHGRANSGPNGDHRLSADA